MDRDQFDQQGHVAKKKTIFGQLVFGEQQSGRVVNDDLYKTCL